jgi:NAD(P)-dependent dehydrogenase (short-subunit alcohol dehydrogenase family)
MLLNHPTSQTILTSPFTGGASGIARALTTSLLSQGWHVFISDRDASLAKHFAEEHAANTGTQTLHYAACDTASWDSQLAAFQAALQALGGRIDFVAPIAGIGEERRNGCLHSKKLVHHHQDLVRNSYDRIYQ